MSKAKRRGTDAENMVLRYLSESTGQQGIRRTAPHGAHDVGDLDGLDVHGHEAIVEVKAHRSYGPSHLAEWRRQTLAERENAGADLALLVVKEYGGRVADSPTWLTIRDLALLVPGLLLEAGSGSDEVWVSMTLAQACELIGRE